MSNGIVLARIVAGGILLASCMTAATDGVRELVNRRLEQDGNRVQVEGFLGMRGGLFNLFSSNHDECVGLLLTDEERERYSELDGRPVRVSGTLQAEGCGRDGICDEDLCGPAILVDVEIAGSTAEHR